jgi:hypothetical protein
MATVMSLPLHNIPFDTPQASEVFIHEDAGKMYACIMTETEKRHIASMLDVPASDDNQAHPNKPSFNDAPTSWSSYPPAYQLLYSYYFIILSCNLFAPVDLIKPCANTPQDRSVCHTCGKHPGVDDLIHNALYMGIHSRDFIWETVTGIRPSEGGIECRVICSRCGTLHERAAKEWRAIPPWHSS